MSEAARIIKKTIFTIYLVALHLIVIYFAGQWLLTRYFQPPTLRADAVADPTAVEPVPTPLPVPSIFYDANTEQANADTPATLPTPAQTPVQIPVAAGELLDPGRGRQT